MITLSLTREEADIVAEALVTYAEEQCRAAVLARRISGQMQSTRFMDARQAMAEDLAARVEALL